MKGKDNSGLKGFKGAFKKALAVVLFVSLLTGMTAGLTGCKFIGNITNGFTASNNTLSGAELARLMANAILNEKSVGDCYEKVPDSQLNGLSYTVFSEYCSILRKCSLEHGTADSFRVLSSEEKQAYFASIDQYGAEDIQSVEKYGDLEIVELCYSTDKKPSAAPVRFAVAKNGDSYSLAGQYITDSMLAYSYINHYFDMIDDGNIDGLEAIIKSSYDSDIYMNSVIREKANYLVEYYMKKVKSSKNNYRILLVSPTHVIYEIPEVFSDDGDSIVSKRVELFLRQNGTFSINDKVPVLLDEIRLSREGLSTKLRMGSTYTAGEIYKLLGEPIFVAYDPGQVIMTYNGMTIRLDAEISENHQWSSGRLVSVVLRNDNEFSLGEDLYVGMNVSELLLIYPMFDECEFTGSFENGDGVYVLSFEFDDYGNISRIKLGEAVG